MGQSTYDFRLPTNLIATKPASRRDNSRLFIYDTATNTVEFDRFLHIEKYLPRDAMLVVNKTVVAPSRISLVKSTGGKVVCLLLVNEYLADHTHLSGMVDRKINVGETLSIKEKYGRLKPVMTAVSHQKGSIFFFRLHVSREELMQFLQKYGSMPIPLYLRDTKLSDDTLRFRYQTIYAKRPIANEHILRVTSPFRPELVEGRRGSREVNQESSRQARTITLTATSEAQPLFSVAAPTAGLHFTQRVFDKLLRKGITRTEVVLEVGLGTFAPLTPEALESGKLHTEWYQVPRSSSDDILQAKAEGKKIIAVGTTVVRTLESYATLSDDEQQEYGKYHPTDIFIREGHTFNLVDCLVTNFHLPNSSLMMLVDAFLQYKCAKRNIIDLYEIAIREKFRFYSFGDSMVIL